MNDMKRREAWLRELKALRQELVSKNRKDNTQIPSAYPGGTRTYQKATSGLASKMYESDRKQSAKIQVMMLAFLTFIFETLFFIGSYFLFKK